MPSKKSGRESHRGGRPGTAVRGAGRALPLVLTCVEAVLVGSSRQGHGLPPLAWKLRGQRPCPQTSLPSMALGQHLPQRTCPVTNAWRPTGGCDVPREATGFQPVGPIPSTICSIFTLECLTLFKFKSVAHFQKSGDATSKLQLLLKTA